ncbi:MAG TPA: DUF92 domain-containing protein [Terriglobales bacterium]|nr:DUF92 domain-containing protein [Terriglobales bacterium]
MVEPLMSAERTILSGPHPLWIVGLVTVLFASLARTMRGVSVSGAVAGGIVCFVLYASVGISGFIMLVLLFILTWAATRLGYQRKQRLGAAEKKEGRTASQVFANVGAASACAAAYWWHGNTLFLLAMCAALAEAAADTVSSEIGQAYGSEARLITNLQKVPAGTNGGVTIIGTLVGVGAAILMTLAGIFSGVVHRHDWLTSIIAPVIGMISDSYLGATLERRGFLSNNVVNFFGTLTAIFVAMILR